MTPQEKVQQLLHEYRILFMDEGKDYGEEILISVLSKQCALIAVNELLNSYTKEKSYGYIISDKIIPYWQEVKQEIEKYT
jgi:hypothetical protein